MRDRGNAKQMMVSRRKFLGKFEDISVHENGWRVGEQTSFIHFFKGRKFFMP